MGIYKYIRNVWKNPTENLGDIWQNRLILWRKQPSLLRIARPTRLDRARSLGYRAKPGVLVVRIRLGRGGHRVPDANTLFPVGKSYQWIAEERANRKYPNCEVLNSYEVARDGLHFWYEIIMVDRDHPAVLKDKELKFIAGKSHRGRVHRGKTSAGRRSRGLYNKGKGAEKVRPSRNANKGRSK